MQIYSFECPLSTPQKQFEQLLPFVEEERQHQIKRLRNDADQALALWSHLMLRALLMEQTSFPNSQLRFGFDSFQKPVFLSDPTIHFNLSHSGQWILCGVCTNDIGVDIEKIEPIHPNVLEVALTINEQKRYHTLSVQERSQYFYQLWTAKESYLKLIGLGMNVLPNLIDVQLKGVNQFHIQSQQSEYEGFGRFYDIHLDYKAAVCNFVNHIPPNVVKIEGAWILSFF